MPCFRDVAPQNLVFLVNSPLQVDHRTVQIDVRLVEVPAPLPKAAHPAHPLPLDVAHEHLSKTVPPHPHCLMTQADPALE